MKNILSLAIVFAIFAWGMSLALASDHASSWCEPANGSMSIYHTTGTSEDQHGPGPYAAGCVNCNPKPPTWHLLTKSSGGTISLIKSLTKDECEFARARLLKVAEREKREKDFAECQSQHHPDGCFWPSGISSAGDIETAECFE